MNVLVGTVTSTPCVAVANETAADNMFQLTPSGSATECVANPNVFRVCFSDPNQGTAAAQYIGEHKLATKVAIIYDSSDVYSSGITQNFTAEAANQGIEIVSSEAFTADNNKDFSVQLQKAKDGGAELVFLPIYYTEASLILAQADSMGFETKFFGCDGMDGILDLDGFDASLAEDLMSLHHLQQMLQTKQHRNSLLITKKHSETHRFSSQQMLMMQYTQSKQQQKKKM